MAAMQRRLDDCEAAALATEKLMGATRRRLDEYEAALGEEQARSTLAEREAAVLREERDGLRVSSAHLVEEAARLRALADAMQDLEAARALRAQQARAEANLNSDLEAEAKTQKAAGGPQPRAEQPTDGAGITWASKLELGANNSTGFALDTGLALRYMRAAVARLREEGLTLDDDAKKPRGAPTSEYQLRALTRVL